MASRPHLVDALAGLVRAMVMAPELREFTSPALLLLSEALLEIDAASDSPLPKRRQQLVNRLAQLERQLHAHAPGERVSAITTRLGIGRAYYYELRANAIELGLIPSGVHKSLQTESVSE